VKLEIKGIPPEWISISPYKIDRLAPGEEKEFLVFIKPPPAAKEGVYQIKVKAKDAVESNEETALFLLSKDERGLVSMLYEQAMKAKEKAEQTLSLSCLDISEIKTLVTEGNKLIQLGKEFMDREEYKKSQEVLLEAIKNYESVIEKANILMQVRYEKIRPFVLPPFINSFKNAKLRLDNAYSEKNYPEFCQSLSNTTKYIAYSIAEVTIFSILLILLAVYAYYEYKKYKERKVEERLKEIKKRLGET
jgi:transcriptional regulator